MKHIISSLAFLVGFSFLTQAVTARDVGRSKGSVSSRASAPSRSPATGSKISRPVSRPATKPAARPVSRPEARPAARPKPQPIQRPTTRPALERPVTRPESRPNPLPDKRPEINRPSQRPELNRPDQKPEFNRPQTLPGNSQRPLENRPEINRPSTLPGMVTYPNRPGKDRPNLGGNDRPNIGSIKRPNVGNINTGNKFNNVHIDKVNVGGHNLGLNRPSTLPGTKRNWNNNQWGGNKGIWGSNNNVNINVNRNFYQNNNFSYRPNYWGARPWWGASSCYPWHHGHWNYGWNSHYYHNHWYYGDDNFASGFMWGIAVWSLGNMVYDMGYHTYRNPYPAPPVQNTTIVYTQPLSVTAAANPPGSEEQTQIAEAKSAEAVERSRAAFKKGDYVTASTAVDEALGYTPGDVTLHEYRSLVLFALGKYADSTGVLNAVLASGPGWGWDTMVAFYDESATYSSHLRKLEAYVKGKPEGAEGHFLLGYHYMVCGFMDKAYEQFDKTAQLQPADSIARQLRDLTKSSLPDAGAEDSAPSVQPAPIPVEKLVGTWVSDRGRDGKITFKMEQDGKYSWSYSVEGKTSDLNGTYGLNDKGLLALSSDDSQMISSVTLDGASKMKFVLIGAPDGDPGLEFTKG